MKPYNVCRGAEKNYAMFVVDIKKDKPIVNENYFKRIVAKCILFNVIDSMVKSKKLGGYKANMDTYIMSSISFLSNKRLNLNYIWEEQHVQQAVIDLIENLSQQFGNILQV